MVEKHITLQQDSSREEAFSGDKHNIAEQARETLDVPIEELSREFGRERVEACLGSGEIGLADCEKAHYGRTNRIRFAGKLQCRLNGSEEIVEMGHTGVFYSGEHNLIRVALKI